MSSILLMLLGIINIVVGLGTLVCFVMVLIKLFQDKGALHGILGIICGLYTFVWGWIESARLGIKQIMLIWTVLLIASIILQSISIFGMAATKSWQDDAARQQQLQQQGR